MTIHLVRGRPGSGKTTVAGAVAARLQAAGVAVTGFVTEEVREGGRRRGFRLRRLDVEDRGVLADVALPGPPRVGRYGVHVAALERLALPALDVPPGVVVVVDELGPMELVSEPLRTAVGQLVDRRDVRCLLTVHARPHPLTDALLARPDAEVHEVTRGDRDALPARLAARLRADPPAGTP